MRTIICLAGGIASGKTTVAQELADILPNSSVRSFGDIVRQRAKIELLPLDRATLQNIGLQLIDEGWSAFLDALLDGVPGETEVLIVDGVRHGEPVEELRRRFPGIVVRLVFLTTDATTLRQRITDRGESENARNHSVELSLEQVAEIADLTLETSSPPKGLAAQNKQVTPEAGHLIETVSAMARRLQRSAPVLGQQNLA